MKRNLGLVAGALAATLSGCGTVRNLLGNNRDLPDRAVYGGAEIAWGRGTEALNGSPQQPAREEDRFYRV
jgi:hypothetical protein